MEVYNVTLESLFEGTKQFVVPLFQRPYSWKKNNWDELWRDLLEICDPSNSTKHFMGAIVTMPVHMQPHGVNKFLLIDGQQRLTTIFVVLACIRDLAGEDSRLSDEIDNLYLVNQFKEGPNRRKLLPTQADRQAFDNIVQRSEHTNTTLSRVYKFFSKALRDADSDLATLLEAMKSQLIFVSIVLNENDNPYRIFHSLNATGTPLTQADLVRNHIFMHIPDDDQEAAYSDRWLPLQDAYPGNQLRDYIWRFVTKDGVPIRQNGVYDAIRKRVADLANSGSADHLLMDLKIVADYYDRILDPTLETVRSIRERLQRLQRWELTTAYPLLLNLYIAFNSQEVSVQTFCDVIDTVESFVVRRHVCNVPIRQLTNYFIRVFHEVHGTHDFLSAVNDYLLDRNFPTDEVFRDNWVRHQLYGPGSREKCRLILESLEAQATRNNEPVDTKHPRITIEHVMPQSLSPIWHEELGASADAIHAQYLHTVGNLTLTGQNESMGNKAYSEKKEVFEQSNFALNRYFADCEKWNSESIVRRAERLGELAVEIWKRPSN